jgi:hypothetical protein
LQDRAFPKASKSAPTSTAAVASSAAISPQSRHASVTVSKYASEAHWPVVSDETYIVAAVSSARATATRPARSSGSRRSIVSVHCL